MQLPFFKVLKKIKNNSLLCSLFFNFIHEYELQHFIRLYTEKKENDIAKVIFKSWLCKINNKEQYEQKKEFKELLCFSIEFNNLDMFEFFLEERNKHFNETNEELIIDLRFSFIKNHNFEFIKMFFNYLKIPTDINEYGSNYLFVNKSISEFISAQNDCDFFRILKLPFINNYHLGNDIYLHLIEKEEYDLFFKFFKKMTKTSENNQSNQRDFLNQIIINDISPDIFYKIFSMFNISKNFKTILIHHLIDYNMLKNNFFDCIEYTALNDLEVKTIIKSKDKKIYNKIFTKSNIENF